jgi:RecJ-like exonuclease
MSNDGIVCPTCHGEKVVKIIDRSCIGGEGYQPCPTCGGIGRVYTRADLDAAVKAERERVIVAAIGAVEELAPRYDLGIPADILLETIRFKLGDDSHA